MILYMGEKRIYQPSYKTDSKHITWRRATLFGVGPTPARSRGAFNPVLENAPTGTDHAELPCQEPPTPQDVDASASYGSDTS